ncbi:YhjD/YihY/BrkB family envelope integrity protein [Mobilicoccus caccae]|uniref:Uncharacterized protein n=1 Tax=Mobilicoccus caccae TaxID=1859295 RepID=A0ABQ6IW92_9MICO|nr:YhjD/YihY/BrkB family envelope integrity protein [Mobilicoccus caccae]GMA41417.1 hypothetical protein GCM10025883_34620 [Mobilicoccus caccae]
MAYRAPRRPTSASDRLRGALGALWRRTLEARIARAGMRYHFGRGGLFSGGVTWSALLSMTAVVTILVNAGRTFLGQNPSLLDDARAAVNSVIPGLIDDGSGQGVIDPTSLIVDSYWNPVTFISMVVAFWAALSVMTGLRRAVRAMFGLGVRRCRSSSARGAICSVSSVSCSASSRRSRCPRRSDRWVVRCSRGSGSSTV